jgi:hypothetical protein
MIHLEQILTLLSLWLTKHEGPLPRTMALDGKDHGGQLGTMVSLVNTAHSGSGKKTPTPQMKGPAGPLNR